jgi:hypothetical protein
MVAEPCEPTLAVPTATVAANGDSAQRVVVIEVIGVARRRRRGSVYRMAGLSRDAIDEATERPVATVLNPSPDAA